MGSKTLMSVGEYLHTTFDGADREYLDGEVVERNMGNTEKSNFAWAPYCRRSSSAPAFSL